VGRSVLIVGFGNRLMADDGAGPAVIDRLRVRGLPRGARAEQGEGDALRLAGLWRGEEEIWLVDALLGGGEPGSLRRLGHEELLALPQPHATAHQLSLPESLRWLAVAQPAMADVRYRLWGITPARVEPVEGLSPAVAEAVEIVAREMLEALEGRADD
jgi:hydrogenase maturation protease